MNLLVTLDSNYVYPLCVMLRSLVRTHPRVSFDVYVAYAHLTDSDFKTIAGRQRQPCDGYPRAGHAV